MGDRDYTEEEWDEFERECDEEDRLREASKTPEQRAAEAQHAEAQHAEDAKIGKRNAFGRAKMRQIRLNKNSFER